MVVLSVGYWICTDIGILSSLFTIGVCWFIMNKHTLKQKTWKKLEYQMILLRVFFDALTSITSGIYFLSSMFTLSYSEVIPFDVSFMIGLISSSLIEMRSYLAVVIAIERSCATIFPIHFFRYRKKIPNIPIVGFIISTGVALCVVMLWYCELKLPLKEGCTNFNCAAPRCYQDYHAVSKTVYSSLNALFSGILCIKLISLTWTHSNIQKDLRKANLLSLTDGLSTLTFELLPATLFTKGIVDFNSIGPVFGVLRQIGRGVEATVMAKLIKQKTWRKLEYQIILIRLALDFLTSVISIPTFIIRAFFFADFQVVSFDVFFMIGVVSISLVEMRSYLAVVIAFERVLATVFPIKFWKYRKGAGNVRIVGFVLTTGCSVPIVMFYLCELRFPSTIGCDNNNCAYPPAYLTYRFLSTIIFSSFDAFFSGILCLKLFCLSMKHTDVFTDLRRANLISLTDGLSSLVFEISPSLISRALDITNAGPVLGVSRQLARAVEATVMAKLMG